MTATAVSLLAAGIPKSMLIAWSALVSALSIGGLMVQYLRYRRFVADTEAELKDLRKQLSEHQREVNARLEQMQAEVDAHVTWSEASSRFLHHGLTAISYRIGAKSTSNLRACISEHQRSHQREEATPAWRPVTRNGLAVPPIRGSCR
ncbi:hypothetical protein [Candidatus Poriferisodalis sp.]|uniref:hypothetical protein n=1 Tax=Candidatus Poriferisodalis sp. TaxID=3101277 RepID=UPI003B01208C